MLGVAEHGEHTFSGSYSLFPLLFERSLAEQSKKRIKDRLTDPLKNNRIFGVGFHIEEILFAYSLYTFARVCER